MREKSYLKRMTEFENYVDQFHMIEADDRIVAGVSGGADSICLLFLLKELQKKRSFSLSVVHVNHSIRESAKRDEEFVVRICEEWGIPCTVVKKDIPTLSKEWKLSEEETGRRVRYEAFFEALDGKAGKIAVAHTKSDRAETLFLNLFRGTGLKGLASIQPVRDNVIRPILFMERGDIEKILNENHISYCTDETNLTNDYARNRIRNLLFPFIEREIAPGFIERADRAATNLSDAQDYVEKRTREAYNRCVCKEEGEGVLRVPALLIEDEFIRAQVLLYTMERILPGRRDVGKTHIQKLMEILSEEGNVSVDLPYGFRGKKIYDLLYLERRKNPEERLCEVTFSKDAEQVEIEGVGTLSIKSFSYEKNVLIPENQYTKWFDYDKIGKSLTVRSRQENDYFVMDEKGHKKKLQDYFVNEKVPKEKRDRVPILTTEGSLVWIIGYRISSQFKIDENTKTVLQIQLEEMKDD